MPALFQTPNQLLVAFLVASCARYLGILELVSDHGPWGETRDLWQEVGSWH
jgi:hypothetical protein